MSRRQSRQERIELAATQIIEDYYERLSILQTSLWSQHFLVDEKDPRGALAAKWAVIFDNDTDAKPEHVFHDLIHGDIVLTPGERASLRGLRTADVFDSIRVVYGFMPTIARVASKLGREDSHV
jgi:hypothetical protein